jgi:hypothetical protein
MSAGGEFGGDGQVYGTACGDISNTSSTYTKIYAGFCVSKINWKMLEKIHFLLYKILALVWVDTLRRKSIDFYSILKLLVKMANTGYKHWSAWLHL